LNVTHKKSYNIYEGKTNDVLVVFIGYVNDRNKLQQFKVSVQKSHLTMCVVDFDYISIIVQRDPTQSSLFTILQVHSTFFGCQPHPSSGAHKTVTTAFGTGHIFCAATSRSVAKLSWPRWGEVAAQYRGL